MGACSRERCKLTLCGFCRLYAFPTQKRLRVAQILIMPPSQKQGLGREMLTAVNKVFFLAMLSYCEPEMWSTSR